VSMLVVEEAMAALVVIVIEVPEEQKGRSRARCSCPDRSGNGGSPHIVEEYVACWGGIPKICDCVQTETLYLIFCSITIDSNRAY